ncbi:hypothetical protein BT09F21_09190 [Escherichia coli]|nr:hypothetical protein C5Y84_24090 [Escherichia coli]
MAKAWDIEPSIFAGMIEEDVGLKIRYIAIQILTAIDIAAPVDTGRFRNNNLVSGNDSNLLIVFYVQIMPDDFVMQLHRF